MVSANFANSANFGGVDRQKLAKLAPMDKFNWGSATGGPAVSKTSKKRRAPKAELDSISGRNHSEKTGCNHRCRRLCTKNRILNSFEQILNKNRHQDGPSKRPCASAPHKMPESIPQGDPLQMGSPALFQASSPHELLPPDYRQPVCREAR